MIHRSPKLRGARRYYSRLLPDAEKYVLPVSSSPDWFDLWHQHIDWDGWGNRGPRHRRHHLRALLAVLQRVSSQASSLALPHQVWAIVDPSDSTSDAVYLHTPNPNGADFPYPFDGVSWGAPTPALLAGLIPPGTYEVGASRYNGLLYWLRQ